MRLHLIRIVACACLIGAAIRTAVASNVAFDTAGDSAYNNGWTNGSNGGYGWGGSWVISSDSYPQPPIAEVAADPALGGIMNSPAVSDGRAWAISDTTARRPLAGPLAVGQTISVDLDGAGIVFHANSEYDFSLVSFGTGDFMLAESAPIKGGFISYEDTGIPVINGPIALFLTMGSNYSFTLEVGSLASPATGGSYSFQFTSDPDEIWLGGGNGITPVYANNLSVTPEPSAFLLAGIAAIGLLRRRSLSPKAV